MSIWCKLWVTSRFYIPTQPCLELHLESVLSSGINRGVSLLFSEGRNPNTAAPVISVWPVSITTADGSTTVWAAETIGETF